ncbi:MAG: thiol reductant ABC exporter subunit CydD [Gemella sp.]|nr:thiol reductant ABC exporter subunit CydD [Gemella sp.]
MSKYSRSKIALPVKKSLYIILLFLSIIEAVCIILQTAFLAKTIVNLFEGNYNIYNYVILFFIGYFCRTIMLHLQQYFTEKAAAKLEVSLREQLIDSYFKNGIEFTAREGSGKLITLSIEGIAQVKNYFELNVSKKLRSVIIPIFIVSFTFYTDKVSAFMISSFIPVIVIFMILLGVTARDMADRQYKKYRILSNNFVDTIRGIESLKFLGIAKNYLPIMENKNSEYRKSTMVTLRYAFLNSFALDILTTLAIAFLAVRLGILLLAGDTNLLPALTVLLIAPEFFLPMKQAATDYHASLNGQVAYEEIINIINNKEKFDNDYKKIGKFEKLELKNVDLVKEGTTILNDINLTINTGDKICIVGPSGSGKTSLISILSGISSSSSGKIKINGEDLTIKNSNWIEKISYISQFPYIFPDTIRNNLEFYLDNHVSTEELDKVAKLVGLYEYINNLDKGYDTFIGESGVELSGGQAQRIVIARALLSDREVVVLDEPTSHLDIETEFEIKEKLLELFKGRTVLIATHRLHWLNNMDYVLNIDSGEAKYFEKLENFRESKEYLELKKSLIGGKYE